MFTRIYSGILFSVLVAVLLNYLLYSMTYKDRRMQYDQRALTGLIQLVSDGLQRQNPEKKMPYLEIVSQLLGTELSVLEKDKLPYSKYPALKTDESGLDWYIQFDKNNANTQIAKFHVRTLSEQQFRGHALMFVAELSRKNNPPSILQLHRYSHYPVSLYNLDENNIKILNIDAQQRSRLKRGSVVVSHNTDDQNSFRVLAPWRDKKIVVLGPIPTFDPLPMGLVIGMLAITMFVIVAVSYWLVYRLASRIKKLSSTVTEFGDGNLDARTQLNGNDTLSELGLNINAMAARIQTLLQSQRDIMQAVSHELRTPLSRMRFRLALLDDADTNNQNLDSKNSKTSGIRKDIDQLESLIDEVLEHHKLNQQPDLEMTDTAIIPLIDETIAGLSVLYPKISFDKSFENNPELKVHSPSFQRLFKNLISNACKHGNSIVKISGLKTTNGYQLIVEDDGSGIPETERKKIFDPFYRVDSSRNKKVTGYGLGLAIVDRIAHLHNAKLTVEDSELGGAKFTLEFLTTINGHNRYPLN